jgi:hypothetical protein
MRSFTKIALAALAVLAVGGWAVAQEPPPAATPAPEQPPAAAAPAPAPAEAPAAAPVAAPAAAPVAAPAAAPVAAPAAAPVAAPVAPPVAPPVAAPAAAPVAAPAAAPVAAPAAPAAVQLPAVFMEAMRVQLDGKAKYAGNVKMEFQVRGQGAKLVSVDVIPDTKSDEIARDLFKQLSLIAGGDVKLKQSGDRITLEKANKNAPTFSIRITYQSIIGVSFLIDKD